MCESLIKVDIFNKNYYTQDNMLISSQGVVLSCWSIADNIVLPDSVTSIGDGAFYKCTNLQSINIPGSVTYIGDKAFEGCESLQAIIIPLGTKHKFINLLGEEYASSLIER